LLSTGGAGLGELPAGAEAAVQLGWRQTTAPAAELAHRGRAGGM